MKLIQTKDYLLLIDEEAKVGKYVWDKEHNYMRENVSRNNITDFDIEIIAYRPLTKEAKELDLPLLPNPFDKQIDEVTHLKNLGHECFIQMKKLNPSGGMKEFIRMAVEFGYKAAQSKQFSLEDVVRIVHLWDNHINIHEEDKGSVKTIEKFIQSLSTQQLPKKFIPKFIDNGEEDWIGDDINGEPFWNEKLELQTITNSEGKEELVGKYVY